MVVVLTIATDKNKYVTEFEQSLKLLGYQYKLLGLGQKWGGFTMKMDLFSDELNKRGTDIVIVCDSYDLLFIQTPDKILNKYHKLANGKVVIGLENITKEFCNFSTICDSKIISTCKIHNPYFPDFIYPNSGFIMGPADTVLSIFQFMNTNNYKDDQLGLFKWIVNNCNQCYFDVHLDFVFNYFASNLITQNANVTLLDNKITIRKNNKVTTPATIHMPAHYLDLGYRSERIRDFFFPGRNKVKKIEYFKEFYGKICNPEFNYFGYWWWVLLIVLILIIVASQLKKN